MSNNVVYAIVKAGGRQEKVAVGDIVVVDRLKVQPGESVTLPALLLVDGEKVTTDAKALAKVTVSAQVVRDERGPKIAILRFKTDQTLPADLAAMARVTGRVVQLPAHNALEVERLLARARETGVVAEDIEIRKADLEDVFLDVMTGASASTAPVAPVPPTEELKA